MKYILFLFFLITPAILKASAIDTVQIGTNGITFIQPDKTEFYENQSGHLSFQKVQSENFISNHDQILNFGLSKSTYWIRFCLVNKTKNDYLYLRIPYAGLDEVTLFYSTPHGFEFEKSGKLYPQSQKQFIIQDMAFELPIDADSASLIYIKLQSKEPIMVPLLVGTAENLFKNITIDDVIFGVYIGIVIIMLLYNLFIYFSAKDKNYLFYVMYLTAIGITQFCLKGYGDLYFWPNSKFLIGQSTFWTGALSGIATLIFSKSFLSTKEKVPSIDKILTLFIILDVISIILSLFSIFNYSYILINTVAFFGSITVLLSSIYLAIKGYRPARYYSIALSFFLCSVILYILMTSNFIAYNNFTRNILLIGSAIEIALLSFALADKINTYKKEKEALQELALQAAKEKEDYIKKENIILESKVNIRTSELLKTNGLLNETLDQLKKAQSKLIEAEKMSSLGQLTAGIAHEINNPINFVKSSVSPLKMDIEDIMALLSKYEDLDEKNLQEKIQEADQFKKEIDLEFIKEEIEQLLTGINEGAERTANIVKELRTFSRLDERAVKEVSIPEAIDATLILIKHIIPRNLTVIKQYNARELIECYPGKINQALMNIITNAVQAVSSQPGDKKEQLILGTDSNDTEYIISIRDTGPGIPEHIREKIFEPFFTTKDVGEGTGLGLSIAFNIIETHKGRIEVHSEEGKGTEFRIFLPVGQTG